MDDAQKIDAKQALAAIDAGQMGIQLTASRETAADLAMEIVAWRSKYAQVRALAEQLAEQVDALEAQIKDRDRAADPVEAEAP